MPRPVRRLTCARCGAAFPRRPGLLGASLCMDCVAQLREAYPAALLTELAGDYRVPSDTIKAWAKQQRLAHHATCLSCGREFEFKSSRQRVCPACAVRSGFALTLGHTRK